MLLIKSDFGMPRSRLFARCNIYGEFVLSFSSPPDLKSGNWYIAQQLLALLPTAAWRSQALKALESIAPIIWANRQFYGLTQVIILAGTSSTIGSFLFLGNHPCYFNSHLAHELSNKICLRNEGWNIDFNDVISISQG